MSTSKFRVCVKLHKTEERKSYFEGPWRKSPEAALDSFTKVLVKHSLQEKTLYEPFIIEWDGVKASVRSRGVASGLTDRGLVVDSPLSSNEMKTVP
jgi:hypothetical protein